MARALCVISALLCGLGGCVSYTPATYPADCDRAYRCTIQGTLRVEDVYGVPMGVLYTGGNDCIMVSLPDRETQRLFGQEIPGYVASGRVHVLDQPDGLVEVQINGRQVGFGICRDVVIYVD